MMTTLDPDATTRALFNRDVLAHLRALQEFDEARYGAMLEQGTSPEHADAARLHRVMTDRAREIGRLAQGRKRRAEHGPAALQREVMTIDTPRPARRSGPGRPKGSKNRRKYLSDPDPVDLSKVGETVSVTEALRILGAS